MSLLCICSFFLLSCSEKSSSADSGKTEDMIKNTPDYEAFHESLRELAVCGYYSFDPRKPVYKLTGIFTIRPRNGSEIYLTSLLNVSLGKALYAAENCNPFFKTTVDDEGRYKFVSLQEGKYVLFIRTAYFPSMNVEPPIPHGSNDSCENLTMLWQGGSHTWSMSAFVLNRSSSCCC